MKGIIHLVEQIGAKLVLLEGLEGYIGKEIYSTTAGLVHFRPGVMAFSQIFPEDQHHVHEFKFDKIVKHNAGCFELWGENRLYISELEGEHEISQYKQWCKYYQENKAWLDAFFKQEINTSY